MPKEHPVRVLHVSDFQFCQERQWDSDPVVCGLIDAVGELAATGLAPDIVAITGDIAGAGRAQDYQEAERWIDRLLRKLPAGFPRQCLLIVPGNHDVDRSAVRNVAQSLQRTLLDAQRQETVADVLGDPESREPLLKPLARYLEFANGLRTAEDRLDVPWWSWVRELNGVPVHFVGLCSSWMAGSDNDQGRLLVGSYQANPLLNDADAAEFRVVLIHHSWDSLAEFDSREIEPLVHRRADLVLRGHLHRERSRVIRDPEDVHLELAAGPIYGGSHYANAFQLVEIYPRAKVVRMHYRDWRDNRWIPDRNAYQAAENGVATIELTPSTGPSPPTLVRGDPTKYLQALRDRTSSIDIRGLLVGSVRAAIFPIDELYVSDHHVRSTLHGTKSSIRSRERDSIRVAGNCRPGPSMRRGAGRAARSLGQSTAGDHR